MQTTLKADARFAGTGLHTGRPARVVVRPAAADTGIWFCRTDLSGPNMIPALWDAAQEADLCTLLVNEAGASVSTVEHLMAALAGCGISNAIIEIDGPEVPLLDGSAAPFVRGFLTVGIVAQDAPNRAIEILKPVEVRRGNAFARLEPFDGLAMEFEIDFTDAAIGRQVKSLNLRNGAFVHELCDSRTFCRLEDVDAMRAAGKIVGGSLTSAVVVDGARVVTPGGLRHSDEPVRHKMLDALGDLALAGSPILGRYVGHRAGHTLTNRLLHALFADPSAWRMVTCDPIRAARLPGAGVTREDMPAAA